MKIKYEKTVVVEEEIEVDERIYDEGQVTYSIANIILDGRMLRLYDEIYHKDEMIIRDAAEQINEAFKKADAILKLVCTAGYC